MTSFYGDLGFLVEERSQGGFTRNFTLILLFLAYINGIFFWNFFFGNCFFATRLNNIEFRQDETDSCHSVPIGQKGFHLWFNCLSIPLKKQSSVLKRWKVRNPLLHSENALPLWLFSGINLLFFVLDFSGFFPWMLRPRDFHVPNSGKNSPVLMQPKVTNFRWIIDYFELAFAMETIL